MRTVGAKIVLSRSTCVCLAAAKKSYFEPPRMQVRNTQSIRFSALDVETGEDHEQALLFEANSRFFAARPIIQVTELTMLQYKM